MQVREQEGQHGNRRRRREVGELVDQFVDDGVGGIEDAVQRRIEQVIADDIQIRMAGDIRVVAGLRLAHRKAGRETAHRVDPAFHLPFEEQLAGSGEATRQRVEHPVDESGVALIAEHRRCLAADQPAEDAEFATVEAGALVVDAAAAERVEHEERAGDLVAPERLLEEDADAEIVGGVIVERVMGVHRPGQRVAAPVDGRDPAVRQGDDDRLVLRDRLLAAVPALDDVVRVRQLLDARHRRLEADIGVDPSSELLSEPFDAAVDGVELHVVGLVHQVVLEAIHRVGLVGLRGQIAVDGHFDVATGDGVLDLFEEVAEGLASKWIGVVFAPVGLVVLGRRDQRARPGNEALEFTTRRFPEDSTDVVEVTQDVAIEHDRAAAHLAGPKSKLINEFS